MAIGQVGFIGIAKEVAWGTPVVVSDYVEAVDESIAVTIDRFETRNITNLYTEADDSAGIRKVEGSLSFPGLPEAMLPFLRGIFGEPTVTEIVSGFLHTNSFKTPSADFAVGQPVAPYTMEVFRDVTSSHRYSGVVFTSMEMSIAPNQEVRMSMGLIGKSNSVIAKTTASFVGSPLDPFTFDTCSISIGGAGTALIEALTINVDAQIEGIPALNASTEIAKIRRSGPQIVSVSGTVDFDNITEYQNFINQTEQPLVLNFTKASSFTLNIDLPRFIYTAFPTGMPGKERLTVGFEGKGRFSTGIGHAIKVDVTTISSGF